MRAQCKFCQFEVGSKCIKKKNVAVRLNKKRSCAIYTSDEEKIVAWTTRRRATKPSSILRSDWFWNRDERRKERDKAKEKEMERYKTTIGDQNVQMPGDSKHPVTGDLSRFSTTVEDNDGK